MTFFDFKDEYMLNMQRTRVAIYHLSDAILHLSQIAAEGYIALELAQMLKDEIDEQRVNLTIARMLPQEEAMRRIVEKAYRIAKICASIYIRTECFQCSKALNEVMSLHLGLIQEIVSDETHLYMKNECYRESEDGKVFRLEWEETEPSFPGIVKTAIDRYTMNNKAGYFWCQL